MFFGSALSVTAGELQTQRMVAQGVESASANCMSQNAGCECPASRASANQLSPLKEAMAGLYFEQFEVGQLFKHATTRTVTETDNLLLTVLSMNPQPLHLDHEFAANTEFKKPLVNSLFTLALVIGLSVQETTLGTTIGNLGMREVSFPKPVFAGDTVHVETTVLAARPSNSRPNAGIVEFEHRGINQRGELVCVCLRSAFMLRNPEKLPANT